MCCIDKKNQRRNLHTFITLLLLTNARSTPILKILQASCGGVTNLTCSSTGIQPGDDFRFSTLVPNGITIYDQTQNGTIFMNKYSVTSNNGSFVLHIYNTSESDNNFYSCNHNFMESNNVSLQIACPASPILTMVPGECGKVTTLTCSSGDIMATDPFTFSILKPQKMTIYDHTLNGAIHMNKYNVVSYNGSFVLQILNTSITDANYYSCDHNFMESNNISLEVVCSQSGTSNTDSLLSKWSIAVTSLGSIAVLCLVICLVLYCLGYLKPCKSGIGCKGSQVSPSDNVARGGNNQDEEIKSGISPSIDIIEKKSDLHSPRPLPPVQPARDHFRHSRTE